MDFTQNDYLTIATQGVKVAIDAMEEYEKVAGASVELTLAYHDAQNLLDKLRNLKQHNEARE